MGLPKIGEIYRSCILVVGNSAAKGYLKIEEVFEGIKIESNITLYPLSGMKVVFECQFECYLL